MGGRVAAGVAAGGVVAGGVTGAAGVVVGAGEGVGATGVVGAVAVPPQEITSNTRASIVVPARDQAVFLFMSLNLLSIIAHLVTEYPQLTREEEASLAKPPLPESTPCSIIPPFLLTLALLALCLKYLFQGSNRVVQHLIGKCRVMNTFA